MTRYSKDQSGKYNIKGKKFETLIGSRAQVWHGTSFKTTGGLTKNDLFQNKNGRVVSKAKHLTAKKEKRLVKAGYGTKKGKFGFVKLGQTKKMRGGKLGVADYAAPVGDGKDSGVSVSAYNTVGGRGRSRQSRRM